MYIGIDPSLANTAVIIGDGTTHHVKTFSTKPRGQNVHDRVKRYDLLVHSIMEWIGLFPGIDAIFIEGYAFSKNDANAKFIAEYRGILAWHAIDVAPVTEVGPTVLKKFCTGKGNADKSIMGAAIASRYGVMFGSNDEFDAYGLYRMALVAHGICEADTAAQREAIAKLKAEVYPQHKPAKVSSGESKPPF